MLAVDDGNNDVVMHDASDGVQVEHVIDNATCIDIVDLVFDNAMYKVSESYKRMWKFLGFRSYSHWNRLTANERSKKLVILGKLVWKRWLSGVNISTKPCCLPFMLNFSGPVKYLQLMPYNRFDKVNSSSTV